MYEDKISPYGVLPSKRQINHFRYYGKKAFFHFGVNTFSNLEWGHGTERESLFNPSGTDVRQWIKTIKAAGFTLAILTVKHNDGFCLWPSKYTEHTIAGSPYKGGKGDIVKEFTEACREFDIAVGLYISPYDRNSPYWGTDGYNSYFNNQLKEILTGYGKIDEVWWDGAGSKDVVYDWGLWSYTVRNYQPDAVIFGSFGAADYIECRWGGNEAGITGDPHYPTIKREYIIDEVVEEMNRGTFGGDKFAIAEIDTSIRPGWFYHEEQEVFVKTSKELVDLWFNSVGNSALMLLNFPPDRRGLVCEKDARSAINAHKIISRALSVNFAEGGTVRSDSIRDGFSPDNIINGNYDSVYAADDNNITPVLEIKLPGEKIFDTFIIGEYIELGIRVKGFRAEAFVEGKWKLLAERKSIGFKRAVYFGETKSDRIRISVTDAGAAPVLREFGIYNFGANGYDVNEKREAPGEKYDIMTNPSAVTEIDEEGITVMLGGVFPFNTVKFNGESFSEYELSVFNGSHFYTVCKGKTNGERVTVRLDETNKASYMFRIITDKKPEGNLEVSVYEN